MDSSGRQRLKRRMRDQRDMYDDERSEGDWTRSPFPSSGKKWVGLETYKSIHDGILERSKKDAGTSSD
jgi:hypothetical protein